MAALGEWKSRAIGRALAISETRLAVAAPIRSSSADSADRFMTGAGTCPKRTAGTTSGVSNLKTTVGTTDMPLDHTSGGFEIALRTYRPEPFPEAIGIPRAEPSARALVVKMGTEAIQRQAQERRTERRWGNRFANLFTKLKWGRK